MLAWFLVLLGLILLAVGAELLVRGAAALATRFGIAPLVVGLTVVAYGTSAPELAVCLVAAFQGSPGLVVGNVVGSNTANLGLVLGAAAVIRPLLASRALLRGEVIFLLISAFLIPLAAMGGLFTRLDGLLLVGGAIAFTVFCFRSGLREEAVEDDSVHLAPAPPPSETNNIALLVLLIAAGGAGLAFGSHLLVEGAVSLAEAFGVSDHIIGLTVVAIGTSLPELATAIASVIRGHVDLLVGNIIGSNVFNSLLILGATAAVHPVAAPHPILGVDMVIMLLMSLALVPMILIGKRISRVDGAIYLTGYAVFLAVSLSTLA